MTTLGGPSYSRRLLVREPVSARERLMLGASVLALLGGVCVLPYAFPHTDFIKGASYETGFNNTVAYLWYLVFLWIPVCALARKFSGFSEACPFLSTLKLTYAPTSLVGAILLWHGLVFAALYAYKGQFVFGDSLYFQTLIYRMTAGDLPYLDFSFSYGPAMLYPGYWFALVLGVEAGYALYFTLTYLLGLYVLYLALQVVLGHGPAINRWFLLFAIAFFNPLAALNVTFLRYLLPVVAFTSAIAYFRTGSGRTLGVATSGLALAMLYTFEAGTVALTSLVVLVLAVLNQDRLVRLVEWLATESGTRGKPDDAARERQVEWLGQVSPFILLRRLAALLCAAFLVCLVAFLVMDPSGRALWVYPDIALSYSAGAHNMPLYPNVPFLTLVALTIMAAAGLLSVIKVGGVSGYEALALGSLGLALLMERGALGVAEPAHVAYYGLPIFLLCLFLLRWTALGTPVSGMLALVLVIGVALPLQYYHVSLFTPFIATHWAKAEARPGVGSAGKQSLQDTLLTMVERIGRDKSYLMFQLDYDSFPIYRKLGLKYPTYFTMMTSSARTHDDIRVIVSQLRANQVVILARRSDLVPNTASSGRAPGVTLLDWLSGAHTAESRLAALMQRSEDRLYQPLRDFVRESYVIELELDGIMALVPKTLKDNGSAAGT